MSAHRQAEGLVEKGRERIGTIAAFGVQAQREPHQRAECGFEGAEINRGDSEKIDDERDTFRSEVEVPRRGDTDGCPHDDRSNDGRLHVLSAIKGSDCCDPHVPGAKEDHREGRL